MQETGKLQRRLVGELLEQRMEKKVSDKEKKREKEYSEPHTGKKKKVCPPLIQCPKLQPIATIS